MELLQLKYFCDAAQCENFSQTARKFQVPVSNISQTIKRLETELGTELFYRQKNRISLNEQGEIFYKGAKEILDRLEETKLQIKDFDGEINGEIKILALTNRRIITNAIEQFKKKYAGCSFVLSHNHRANPDDFDIIIADENYSVKNYISHTLVCERILLAARKGYIAEDKPIRVSDLINERFISMPSGSSLHLVTKCICNNAGFEPRIVIESDDPYYIRKYIELGLGVAFVPSLSWKGEFSDKIVLRDICDEQRKTCVYMPENRYISKSVKMFAKILLKTAQRY